MNKRILRYSCFDLDDNLLYMNTPLILLKGDKDITVSSKEFAKIRHKIGTEYFFTDYSLDEFENEDRFILDVISAVKEKRFAPSWKYFITTLKKGNLFSIITARSNNKATIKKAIEWIIYNYLTEQQRTNMLKNLEIWNKLFDLKPDNLIQEYLDSCKIYCVSGKEFKEIYGDLPTEEAKKKALKEFTKKVHEFGQRIKAKIKLSFSDDDIKNVETIKKYMSDELSLEYPMTMIVFDSSKDKLKKDVIKKV